MCGKTFAMVIEFASPHAHAPAERLFCRANDACQHSGPAISLAALDSFSEHFVRTFATAMAEAAHLHRRGFDPAVRKATARTRESR